MFRYVIKGKTQNWYKLEDVSISMMQYFSDVMNKMFGNNWYIEYRSE